MQVLLQLLLLILMLLLLLRLLPPIRLKTSLWRDIAGGAAMATTWGWSTTGSIADASV